MRTFFSHDPYVNLKIPCILLYPPLLRGRISSCCLTSFFLNAWLDLAVLFAEAPLNKHSWNRSRAPELLVAKEADTNNCSQNCVFGPYLESIFWAQKLVLWLHTSISLAKKRARKTHPKASPENPQLCAPCLKKNQPHKQQKPCPFGHQASVEKASSDGGAWQDLNKDFLAFCCPHAEEADTMTEHSKGTQNGAKLRPQNKVRNLEHQAMRGDKTFWKTTRRWAPAYAPCPESGLGALFFARETAVCALCTSQWKS